MTINSEQHKLLDDFRTFILDRGISTADGQGVDREWLMQQSLFDFEKRERRTAV